MMIVLQTIFFAMFIYGMFFKVGAGLIALFCFIFVCWANNKLKHTQHTSGNISTEVDTPAKLSEHACECTWIKP